MASNRFEFLKQSQQDDDNQQKDSTAGEPTTEETKSAKKARSKKSVSIPGLEPKQDEKVPLDRLNVEIPADLHQQLKEYCTATRRTKREVVTALIKFLIDEYGG